MKVTRKKLRHRSKKALRHSKRTLRRRNTYKSKRVGGIKAERKEKKVNKVSLPSKEGNKDLEDEIKKCDYSVIKFYMNGCPHCDNIKQLWEDLGNSEELEDYCEKNNCKIGVLEVEVREYKNPVNKYIGENDGVPHIIKVNKKGEVVKIHKGDRNIKNFMSFAMGN